MEYSFEEDLPSTTMIIEGSNHTFHCGGPDSYPPISHIVWISVNHGELVTGEKFIVNGDNLTLLDAILLMDNDHIFCRVSNGIYTRNSSQTHILTQKKPSKCC